MLFAKPHWTWEGPDRWIEMQLTVPGKLNVIGMQTMGLPVVQTGFNQNTAWAGTTSMPQRHTLSRLRLGRTATSYLEDGVERKMTPRIVTVRVRSAGGAITTRQHRILGSSSRGSPTGSRGWRSSRPASNRQRGMPDGPRCKPRPLP